MKRSHQLITLLVLVILMAGIAYQRGLFNHEIVDDLTFRAQQIVGLVSAPSLDKLGHPIDVREPQTISFETRLLYTTLLGRPYGMASEDLFAANLPKQLSGSGYELAIAARQALRIPDGGLFTSQRSLVDFLSTTTEPYEITGLPQDFPRGTRADDIAMLHVYALVMSGEAPVAVDLLAKYLDSKTDFTRAFCIMALRAVGTPKAMETIKGHLTTVKNENNKQNYAKSMDIQIANDALAFAIPNFMEPKAFAAEVMPIDRFRVPMLRQAQLNTTKSILPMMLLGYVGTDVDAAQIDKELTFLRGLYKTADQALWRKYMYGYNALAFRSQEPFEQWLTMYQNDADATRRSFILRAMSTQHPDRFHAEMLPLFEKEVDGWPQFEFLSIYTGLVKGNVLYGPFDSIWMPPMRYRVAYPAVRDKRKARSTKLFIDMWASGRFPQDAKCSRCSQSWVLAMMTPEDEPKFVKGFLNLQNRDEHIFGDLADLKQVRLAPVVKFLAERETDDKLRKVGLAAHASLLESASSPSKACCADTEECLRQHVSALPLNVDTIIKSEAAAATFLDQLIQGAEVEITFTDALKRRAIVKQPAFSRAPQIFEHWLGCWRRDGDDAGSK